MSATKNARPSLRSGMNRAMRRMAEKARRLADKKRSRNLAPKAAPKFFEPLEPRVLLSAAPAPNPDDPIPAISIPFENPDGQPDAIGVTASAATIALQGEAFTLNLGGVIPEHSAWRISWGDGQTDEIDSSQRAVTHTYLSDPATRNILIELVDSGGNLLSLATHTVEVRGTAIAPPAVQISGDFGLIGDAFIYEGSEFSLALDPGNKDILSWRVDWGDGSGLQNFNGDVRQISHTYADGDDTHTITVYADQRIANKTGAEGHSPGYWKQSQHFWAWTGYNQSDSYNAVFGVNAPNPGTLLTAVGTGGGKEIALRRQAVAALLNATSPLIHFKYTVDEVIAMVQGAYISGDYANVEKLLKKENDRGADMNKPAESVVQLVAARTVFVANVAPTLSAGGPSQIDEGDPYTLTLGSGDPGQDTIFQWVIDWGDGSTPQVVTGNPDSVTHVYQTAGAYTITTRAHDEDGAWDGPTLGVAVGSVYVAPPTLNGAASVLEGSDYTLELAPGGGAVAEWIVDWGDGSDVERFAGNLTEIVHRYTDGDAGRVITVTGVQTDAGGRERAFELAKNITEQNVPPTLGLSAPAYVSLGSSVTVSLSAIDPGDDTITSWIVDWGDGSAPQMIEGNPDTATYTYAATGTYTVSVKAVDEDGTWDGPAVNIEVGGLRLVEHSRFHTDTEAELAFYVPENPGAIQLRILDLFFDENDSGRAKDAFELALLDMYDRPVAGTIMYGRDAVFNITEGMDPAMGRGVTYDPATGLVTVDIGHLEAGTMVRLVARLVNNDGDTTTTVVLDPNLVQLEHSPVVNPTTATTPDDQWERNGLSGNVLSGLSNVTEAFHITYGRSSFNDLANTFHADVTVTYTGSNYPVRGPLVVAVRDLSEEAVKAFRFDGYLADGTPYFTIATEDIGVYAAGQIAGQTTLRFENAGEFQFTYRLEILGQLNRAPAFVTEPGDTLLQAGRGWTYDAKAEDPDDDALTYNLISGPNGMDIDAAAGRLTWTPGADDLGQAFVVIEAVDPYGLRTTQTFNLNVVESIPNRPPVFVTIPVTEAHLEAEYVYESQAADPDLDDLAYRIVDGPAGMAIDAATGRITWDPPAELVGQTVTVEIEAADGRGGFAYQRYDILIMAAVGNNPPIIISTPQTEHSIPDDTSPATNGVSPAGVNINLEEGESHRQTVELTIPTGLVGDGDINFTPPAGVEDAMVVHTINPETGQLWTPEELKNVLLGSGGAGIVVKDFSVKSHYSGDISSVGVFVNNNGTYSMGEYGLVLCSGDAKMYGSGPNQLGSYSHGWGVPATGEEEELLDPITGHRFNHNDVSRMDMTFDMLPGRDTLYFDVVFASEEWPDFRWTSYIDAFGLYINGENVAFVDDLPINIDHPDMRWYEGTEANAVLVSKDGPVLRFAVKVPAGSRNNSLTFIVADSGDTALDTIAYISNIGGTPSLSDVEIIASNGAEVLVNHTGTIEGAKPGDTLSFDIEIVGDGNAHSFDLLFVDKSTGTILGSMPVAVNHGYTYQVLAVDEDGDDLSYRLVEGPAGAVIDADTGLIQWNTDVSGQFDFAVEVSDGRGGFDTQRFTLMVKNGVVNAIPTINSVPPVQGEVGRAYQWDVDASDLDGDALSYFLTDAPQGMTIDKETGRISWTPAESQSGKATVSILVMDKKGGQVALTWEIDVAPVNTVYNTKPIFTSTPDDTVLVNKTFVYRPAAHDLDGDPLTFAFLSGPEGMTFDPTTGALAWKPGEAALGTHQVILRVSDGRGGTALQVFTVEVVNENFPPNIISEPPAAVFGFPYYYEVKAEDPNGDPITFRLDDASLERGMYINPHTGLLVWGTAVSGSHEVTIYAEDDKGAVGIQRFTLAVEGNEPAQITSEPTYTVHLGSEYVYRVETHDPDGDEVTLMLENAPEGMTIDPATGTIRWTPEELGTYQVAVIAVDTKGEGVIQYFTVSVIEVPRENTPPQITSQPTVTAKTGQTYRYQVSAVDAENDKLTYSLVSPPSGMSINANTGELTWTPSDYYALGNYTVKIVVTDAQGATATQTYTLTLEKQPNRAPRITSSISKFYYNVGDAFTYTCSVNDPDSNESHTYGVDQESYDKGFRFSGNRLTWTAAEPGYHTVTITVTDRENAVCNQTFTLLVLPPEAQVIPNRPPYFTTYPEKVRISLGQTHVYAANTADPENHTVFVAVDEATFLAGGRMDGKTLTWTPDAVGEYAITLTATDALGAETTQTYVLVVEEPHETPIPEAPYFTSAPDRINVVRPGEYRFRLEAEDPNDSALRYELDYYNYGYPPGISIVGDELVVNTDYYSNYNVTLQIRVVNAEGAYSTKSIYLGVSDNTIYSNYGYRYMNGVLGDTYEFEIPAAYAEWTATLDSSSVGRGVRIEDGKVVWTSTSTGSWYSTLTLQDGSGGRLVQVEQRSESENGCF